MATDKYIIPKFAVFDIYKTVFGYRALPYPTLTSDLRNWRPTPGKQLSILGEVLYKKEPGGAEAFCPVLISKIVNGKAVKKYSLPFSTISMTMSKRIEKTALIGRRGTVKELIQVEDYKFTIRGVVMGEDLPEEGLLELNELFNLNEPVALENAFTAIFLQSDNSVVIESIDFPDMKGITGAQAYSIEVISDTILELEDVNDV